MDAEQALGLTEELALLISTESPVLSFAGEDPAAAREALCRLLEEKGRLARMDDEYLDGLLDRFRLIPGDRFLEDPYLACVKPETPARAGNFLLARVEYRKGELLQAQMPDYAGEYPKLTLGCFSSPVSTLALYEGGMPWMTVCPSELSSMQKEIRHAHGKVLTLGLGLGYYAFAAAQKPDVTSVTAVELQPGVIRLFQENLLPFFPNGDKIRLVQGDALRFCETLEDGEYDYCFADLWAGQEDGAPLYLRLRELLSGLRRTQTEYWIEKELRAWLVRRFSE